MPQLPSPPTSTRSRATTTTARPSNSSISSSASRPSTSAGLNHVSSASRPASRNGTARQTQSSASAAAAAANTSSTRIRGASDKENTRGRSGSTQAGPRRSSILTGMRGERPLVRTDSTAQRHANEVEGLKDYKFGPCLGRGAFGSVYSAFHWSTGETVAIKQVKLSDMPKAELNVIMQEIDLLKNLIHPNIVKYHGFERTSENLWIILEFCENGSLHDICKKFGKFPENLVGLYTAQVLQGLLFLHDQGVIHRDIKGANILTTKEGLIKLADFGVATKQQGLAEGSVVGTPYWMAPEVIELSGATTASDIWSLGCTVIELLDGKPPYHKFAPMPALFRIVNDDHPPLPEGCSPLVRDFLMQCFQKDPNLRVSAKKLLRHPWIMSAKRADTSTKGEKKMEYNEAVKHVQEWNEALKSSPPTTQNQRAGNAVTGRKAVPRPKSRGSALPVVSQQTNTRGALKVNTGASSANPPFRLMRKSSGGAPIKRNAEVEQENPQAELLADHRRLPGANEAQTRDNWDHDFESLTTEMSALQLPTHRKPQDNFKGLFSSERLKQYANFDAIPENEVESRLNQWDEDFEGGEDQLTVRSPLQLSNHIEKDYQHQRNMSKDSQPKTQILRPVVGMPQLRQHENTANLRGSRPTYQQSPGKKARQGLLAVSSSSNPHRWAEESEDEDYSDLLQDNEEEEAFRKKLNGFSPNRPLSSSDLASKLAGSMRRNRRRTHTPTQLVHDAAAMRRTRSSLEIQKYAESEDDEDFGQDLVFDDHRRGLEFAHITNNKLRGSPGTKSSIGSDSGDSAAEQLRQDLEGSTLKISNSVSWNDGDDEEDDEEDPFAQLEEELDDVDLELNVAREKYARLCTLVEGLIGSIKKDMAEDDLALVLDQLLGILDDSPTAEDGNDIRSVVVSSHGMLPILEILEEVKRQDIVLRLLRIVNRILEGSAEVQENLCFVGGIPVVTQFAGRKFSTEIRLEAASFVRMMYTTAHPPEAAMMMVAGVWRDAAPVAAAPPMTLQMFVACGGLNVLVEFLEEDYDTPAGRELVLIGVNGIWSVFELQGSTPKNDFCRIFSRSAALYPLSLILNRVLDEEGDLARVIESRIVNIFLLFSQAENHVKETVADRMVLKRVLKDLRRMGPASQITMLKFIKNLSMLATTLDALQNSNAIEILTDFLGTTMEHQQSQSRRVQTQPLTAGNASNFREITNQLLNTMFNLCRLSKSRQEDAALSGLIPLLQRIVQTERPLKEFALPILCDMAHSGKVGRKILWQNRGIAFYVELLKEPYWAVTALDALFVWLQEETGKVEECLLMDTTGGPETGSFTEAIVNCFVEAKADAFENLLEPMQKMLRLSPSIAARLSSSRIFFERAVAKVAVAKKALVRLNLLRVVRSIVDAAVSQGHAYHQTDRGGLMVGQLVRETGLHSAAQRLRTEDPAILVREMAGDLVRSCEQSEIESRRDGASSRRSPNGTYAGTPLSAISAGRPGSSYFDFLPSTFAPPTSGLGPSDTSLRRQSTAPSSGPRMSMMSGGVDYYARSSSRSSTISETSSTASMTAALPTSMMSAGTDRARASARQSLATGMSSLLGDGYRNARNGGSGRPSTSAGRLSLATLPPAISTSTANNPSGTESANGVPLLETPTHHAPPSANTRAAAQLAAQGRKKRG